MDRKYKLLGNSICPYCLGIRFNSLLCFILNCVVLCYYLQVFMILYIMHFMVIDLLILCFTTYEIKLMMFVIIYLLFIFVLVVLIHGHRPHVIIMCVTHLTMMVARRIITLQCYQVIYFTIRPLTLLRHVILFSLLCAILLCLCYSMFHCYTCIFELKLYILNDYCMNTIDLLCIFPV